ncbi:hypothetical protein [Mycobacterium lepromatosis]|uniref:hypothetical protein n=1 Tax=Mycobacterium lepromatosis TaxID=480418 RepID=UPI000B00A754|nr:hypothetical protein [Mycobacterium lepromatosis]
MTGSVIIGLSLSLTAAVAQLPGLVRLGIEIISFVLCGRLWVAGLLMLVGSG